MISRRNRISHSNPLLCYLNVHAVFQPEGATSPCARAKSNRTKDAVTSPAPTQSTRLSRFSSRRSLGTTKNTEMAERAAIPQRIKNIALQRILNAHECKSSISNSQILSSVQPDAYEDNSVTAPPTSMPIDPPTGAPHENVAKAMDRALPGGNSCAIIPI